MIYPIMMKVDSLPYMVRAYCSQGFCRQVV